MVSLTTLNEHTVTVPIKCGGCFVIYIQVFYGETRGEKFPLLIVAVSVSGAESQAASQIYQPLNLLCRGEKQEMHRGAAVLRNLVAPSILDESFADAEMKGRH